MLLDLRWVFALVAVVAFKHKGTAVGLNESGHFHMFPSVGQHLLDERIDDFVSKAVHGRSGFKERNGTHSMLIGRQTRIGNSTSKTAAHRRSPKGFLKLPPTSASVAGGQSLLAAKTCQVGTEEGCKQMCWWLMLTSDASSTVCPLFEHPLRACGYLTPEHRPPAAGISPLDSVVGALRAGATASEVGDRVLDLTNHMDDLPTETNETCAMALSLVRREVSDWWVEVQLRANASRLTTELDAAIAQSQAALETRSGQKEALAVLSELLPRAEALPGHYLAERVHAAQALEDRLEPIPAVQEELVEAIEDAHKAMASESMRAIDEAEAWLTVAVAKASRLPMNDPIPRANQVQERLTDVRSVLFALQQATVDGNVSAITKTLMPGSIISLREAVELAAAYNITRGLRTARRVLASLEVLEAAVDASENATRFGQNIINTVGLKGEHNLRVAASLLNRSIGNALRLGLENDESTTDAVATIEALRYAKHARIALHDAVLRGRGVLELNRSSLSDDAEEVAVRELEARIAWGEDVGLVRGLPVAERIASGLSAAQAAKERMVMALAVGNSSWLAGSGEEEAIAELASAIQGSHAASVTGGIPAAEALLSKLSGRKVARSALAAARGMAVGAVESRSGERHAAAALNASAQVAARVGLFDDASAAQMQAGQLQDFGALHRRLQGLLSHAQQEPGPLPRVETNDSRPNTVFNRTGLRVDAFPSVPNSEDDGDADFEEHIQALAEAMAEAQAQGVVDPAMERQLAQVRRMRNAYDQVSNATSAAKASLATETRPGLQEVVVMLTAAVAAAQESGLALGVPAAERLLERIRSLGPAQAQLDAAALEANVSIRTVSGMNHALERLHDAIGACDVLDGLCIGADTAARTHERLIDVRGSYVALKAAVVQGTLALQNEEGEEAAIMELSMAITDATEAGVNRDIPVALDLLTELRHMNTEHDDMQTVESELAT